MGISRRDTIIIAVFVNALLLVVLFGVASKIEEERALTQAAQILDEEKSSPQVVVSERAETKKQLLPMDEIDEVLKAMASKQKELPDQEESLLSEADDDESDESENKKDIAAKENDDEGEENFISVKVKKGDVLSKIAKSYNSTVEEIMTENKLTTTKLRIGQELKIPVKHEAAKVQVAKVQPAKKVLVAKKVEVETEQANTGEDSNYYTIKSGDNPWKIAKRYNLEFEELLTLNNLDEEKAKNLKIGQKIRIK